MADATFYRVAKQQANGYPVVEGTRCVSVQIPDDDSFLPVLAALVAGLGNTWATVGTPEERRAWSQMWQIAYAATDWEGCMNCCDDILAALAEQQTLLEEIRETQNANATSERELQQSAVGDDICGGAGAVADAMYGSIMAVYTATENGFVDNAFELIPLIISYVPILSAMPFDELFELANSYFENQVTAFQDSWDVFRQQLVDDLSCFVQANGNVFDWDVWALWTEYIGTQYPTEPAAIVMARYSPARQTWLNQILAQVNKNQSLGVYFETLSAAWDAGILNPETACVDCSLAHLLQVYSGHPNFGGTLQKTIPIVSAVGFELESYDLGSGRWGLAIEADGTFEQGYIINPNPVAPVNPGEICWYLVLPDGTPQFGLSTAENAADMPSVSDVKMIKDTTLFCVSWEAFEPFTVNITLTNA